MKRKMKVLLIILLIMMLCSTVGCNSAKKVHKQSLFMTAVYSIVGPYESLNVIKKESNVDAHIEKDQYGRELFVVLLPIDYWFYSPVGERTKEVSALHVEKVKVGYTPTSAMFIIQKYDNEHIYYYEDYCFLLKTQEGFSNESIEELKGRNDWNKPLQLEKCSIRKNGEMYEGMSTILWDKRSRNAIKKAFSDEIIEYSVVEDANGKQLFGVFTHDEKYDSIKAYYVIYDPSLDMIDPEKGIMEVTSLDYGEELHELKIRNNWNFKDCPGELGDGDRVR